MAADPFKGLRVLRGIVIGMFVGFLPFGGVLIWLDKQLGLPNSTKNVLIVGYMATLFVVNLVMCFWKCPRCGKPFLNHYWWANQFASSCVWCGQHMDDTIGSQPHKDLI